MILKVFCWRKVSVCDFYGLCALVWVWCARYKVCISFWVLSVSFLDQAYQYYKRCAGFRRCGTFWHTLCVKCIIFLTSVFYKWAKIKCIIFLTSVYNKCVKNKYIIFLTCVSSKCVKILKRARDLEQVYHFEKTTHSFGKRCASLCVNNFST